MQGQVQGQVSGKLWAFFTQEHFSCRMVGKDGPESKKIEPAPDFFWGRLFLTVKAGNLGKSVGFSLLGTPASF